MNPRREFQSLDAYLDYVRQLMLSIPKAERDEALKEMAQHLQALAEAEEAAGALSDQAVRNAVAWFGDPDRVASLYRREWLHRYRLNEFASWRRALLLFLRYAGIILGAVMGNPFGTSQDIWYRGIIDGLGFGTVARILLIVVPPYRPKTGELSLLPRWVPQPLRPLFEKDRMLLSFSLMALIYAIELLANGHFVFVASYYPTTLSCAYLFARASKGLLARRQNNEPYDSEPKNG